MYLYDMKEQDWLFKKLTKSVSKILVFRSKVNTLSIEIQYIVSRAIIIWGCAFSLHIHFYDCRWGDKCVAVYIKCMTAYTLIFIN